MDVTPLIREGQQIIQSYAAGVFRISGVSYEGAVFVAPAGTILWDNVQALSDLTIDSFSALLEDADNIDVLLLGTGNSMQFINPEFRQEMSAKGLPLDIMDTGAACRTYNVLMAEGRRVVAALLPTL